jgi:subtilisin family serine protease
MIWTTLSVALLAVVQAVLIGSNPSPELSSNPSKELLGNFSKASTQRYIVVFKDGDTSVDSLIAAQSLSGSPTSGLSIASDGNSNSDKKVKAKHVYKLKNLRGYSTKLSSDDVDALKSDPTVAQVVLDMPVKKSAVTVSNARWDLVRIATRNLALSSTKYTYPDSAGSGVTAYIIDTGIYTAHSSFQGRAKFGASFITGSVIDDNGHGTHVAGTIGSYAYGVAKKVNLVAVKVLDNAGISCLIEGILLL